MRTTYRGELKELKGDTRIWKQERNALLSGDDLELRKLKLPENEVHHNVEIMRRNVRIEEALKRIHEITGKNKPSRSVNGYDGNLPPGLDKDPGDVTELKTCPHCNGDCVEDDFKNESMMQCRFCSGAGTVYRQDYDDYKGREMTEDELDLLNHEHREFVHEKVFDHLF